jgi:hypothetical protein
MFRKRTKTRTDLEKFAGRVGGKNCQPFSMTVDLIFSVNGTPWLEFNGERGIMLGSNSLEEVLLTINKYVKENYT